MKRLILTFMLAFALLIAANANPVKTSKSAFNKNTTIVVKSNAIQVTPDFILHPQDPCVDYALNAAVRYYEECGVTAQEAVEFGREMYDFCHSHPGSAMDPVFIC